MVLRVLRRLAILWAFATGVPLLLVLFHNWGHFYTTPNYYAVILFVMGPLIAVQALAWVFKRPT